MSAGGKADMACRRTPNNLLAFLRTVARGAQSMILGTATQIQLDVVELWDLLSALNQGAPQVLGTHMDGGEWTRQESIQFLTGQRASAERDQPLGLVPQPVAACRRASRIPRHPQ